MQIKIKLLDIDCQICKKNKTPQHVTKLNVIYNNLSNIMDTNVYIIRECQDCYV